MARGDPIATIPKFKYLTIFSTSIYILCSLVLVQLGLGAAGLFIGNVAGMLTRIVISWNIEIKKHITLGDFVRGIRPSWMFLVTMALCLYFSYWVRGRFMELSYLYDLAIGIVLFGVNLLPVLY